VRAAWVGVAVVAVAASIGGSAGAQSAPAGPEFVLSPEGNHLWAYDAGTGEHQLVVAAQNGEDPGASTPNGIRRDINGQICVSPDGSHVVTGEDTVVAATSGGDGGSSHDPRIAGWGYFAITGSALGEIAVEQVGKLAPEAGEGPGYAGDPDNYGCGFLDEHRLFTTAIGNTLPGEEANGQLFLWFGPFDNGFRTERDPDSGVQFFVGEVGHCEVDRTLATAGGIAVDANGDVYVAANRPTEIPGGDPAGVWRYSGRWPTSLAECTPEYLATNITRTLVIPSVGGVPADVRAPTPSAVVVSPAGTLYVSSVFSGTVAEFRKDGTWVRDLYPLSPITPFTGPTTQTPFGLAVTSDGALWIADLGIAIAQPAPAAGSVIRLGFAGGSPTLPAETIRDGLTFPDGLGVYRPRLSAPSGPSAPSAPGQVTASPAANVAAGSQRSGGELARTGAEVSLVVPAVALAGVLVARRRR
jgi:hypothetical protein